MNGGIAYQHASGYSVPKLAAATLELGGAWRFYKAFWGAHDLKMLPGLIAPEIMAKPMSRFVIPLVIQNPAKDIEQVQVSLEVPQGWTFVRKPPSEFRVDAQGTYNYVFEVKTGPQQKEWQPMIIKATSCVPADRHPVGAPADRRRQIHSTH